MKKKKVCFSFSNLMVFLVVVTLVIFIIGFGLNRFTGHATSGTANLNITVGNNAPSVIFVSAVPSTDPSENSIRYIEVNFTAMDSDGVANLNDSTAFAYVNRSGESIRQNVSCSHVADNGANSANYTCRIGMWYFDGAGSWSVNANITDVNAATAENHTTSFTYNLLTAMVMSPNSLTWPTLTLSATNQESNNDPVVINNTGNDDNTIDVTAIDLRGESATDEYIYAGNFTVHTSSGACGSGTVMVNGTATAVSGASLPAGNNSVNDGDTGQEQLFYCITALNPDISSQSYSTGYASPWTIEIV